MVHLEQDLLYDHFDSYTSDRAAYFDRQTSRLTWDVTYAVTIPLAGAYEADTTGGVRRVEDPSASITPFGSFVLFRSALVAPAVF
ncbi:MAG TPA: hypothetical protein EYQ83_17245, partial [Acidobacteria bacterium]|nr:hypothetical protein [Acidobacteriota bacterium]